MIISYNSSCTLHITPHHITVQQGTSHQVSDIRSIMAQQPALVEPDSPTSPACPELLELPPEKEKRVGGKTRVSSVSILKWKLLAGPWLAKRCAGPWLAKRCAGPWLAKRCAVFAGVSGCEVGAAGCRCSCRARGRSSVWKYRSVLLPALAGRSHQDIF